jgi:hypothetical protein
MKLKFAVLFMLGILIGAVGVYFIKTFFPVNRPEKGSVVEDWGEICVWQDVDGIYLSMSPRGCYSPTCTQTIQQTGTAVLDLQNQAIHLTARFVLQETSRFPLPCVDNCAGGGNVLLKLDQLLPNTYTLWFLDQEVGEVNIFSGRVTPRQCFQNRDG